MPDPCRERAGARIRQQLQPGDGEPGPHAVHPAPGLPQVTLPPPSSRALPRKRWHHPVRGQGTRQLPLPRNGFSGRCFSQLPSAHRCLDAARSPLVCSPNRESGDEFYASASLLGNWKCPLAGAWGSPHPSPLWPKGAGGCAGSPSAPLQALWRLSELLCSPAAASGALPSTSFCCPKDFGFSTATDQLRRTVVLTHRDTHAGPCLAWSACPALLPIPSRLLPALFRAGCTTRW